MIDHRRVRIERVDTDGGPDGLADTSDPLSTHERSENFPVALRFLPRQYRRDLRAIYAFARGVDELGDSAAGDRTAQLRRLDGELGRIWTGGGITDPVLVELRKSVTARDLPAEPFHRLVAANLQDQVVTRYPTYDDLLGYCRLSADPVGRMVLRVFGQDDCAVTVELSDRVCTALQLLEHWQDVAEDRRAGRIYLPLEDLTAHGVAETDLDAPVASAEVAALMRFEIDRAAQLLEDGAAIVGRLHGWARPCVAGFVAGGRATVAALHRTGGDVLGQLAAPSKAGTAGRLLTLWAGFNSGSKA